MTNRRPMLSLGRLVATPGALAVLEESGEAPLSFIRRHANGDWGDVDDGDSRTNDEAARRRERVISSYRTKYGSKLWIITEADRSQTTLLTPDEY